MEDSVRQRIVDLYSMDAPKVSFRAIGREVGVAASTVAQVLRESGLVVGGKKKPARQAQKTGDESLRPSLRAVAERAGVSVATVSFALRGSPRVAEKTGERVRQVAREMNYEVHPYVGAQLAAVRRGRVKRLQANLVYLHAGYQGKRTWQEWLEFPSGPRRYFEAAREAALKRGYNLEPVDYKEAGRSMKRLDQILKSRGVRGIILDAPSYVVSDDPFDFSDYATVALREQNAVSSHVFGHDNFLNTLRSVCYLWRLGYRRIGFIASDALSLSTLFARESGMRHAQCHIIPESLRLPFLHLATDTEALLYFIETGGRMAVRNRPDAHEWVFSKNWKQFIFGREGAVPNQSDVRRGILKRWLDEYAPEVVVCEDFRMMKQIQDLGFSVPEDIGLVHNNINFDVEDWSGIKRANASIGMAAAENVCNAVELGQVGPPSVASRQLFPGEWNEGRTTRSIQNPLSPYTDQADRFIRRVLV